MTTDAKRTYVISTDPTNKEAEVVTAPNPLNEAQEKVAETVLGEVLRFFRNEPYSETDLVLGRALAENVVRRLVADGWL